MEDIFCLIMAGGAGTRFWPGSKVAKPKQYLTIVGEDSLLQSTIKRFSSFSSEERIFIVSGKDQSNVLEEQTPMLPKKNLIYEPVGKNTLPCIGLAAMVAEKENPEGIMVVSPSDHLVENVGLFKDTVLTAVKIASEREGIVTLGISPSYPATGYGYIKAADEIKAENEIRQFKVDRFVEKPDKDTATAYLNNGGYYWNSGLFIFKISVFLKAVEEFAPELYADLKKIQSELGKPSYDQTLDTIYRAINGISVDYGIMEHAKNIYLVEGNFDWNDLGSWESVYQVSPKDKDGNVKSGEGIFVDSKNSYIKTDNGLVALVGLDDVIVVQDGNTTLVCKRDKAEDVKKIVEQLRGKNKNEFL